MSGDDDKVIWEDEYRRITLARRTDDGIWRVGFEFCEEDETWGDRDPTGAWMYLRDAQLSHVAKSLGAHTESDMHGPPDAWYHDGVIYSAKPVDVETLRAVWAEAVPDDTLCAQLRSLVAGDARGPRVGPAAANRIEALLTELETVRDENEMMHAVLETYIGRLERSCPHRKAHND